MTERDVCGHVVRPLLVMPESMVTVGNNIEHKSFQILTDTRIGVFADNE